MSRIEADKQEERRKMCGSLEDVVRFFSFFYSVVVFFFHRVRTLNPLILKISLVILITVCHITPIMLVLRI